MIFLVLDLAGEDDGPPSAEKVVYRLSSSRPHPGISMALKVGICKPGLRGGGDVGKEPIEFQGHVTYLGSWIEPCLPFSILRG